ncbi:MAG: hypothetical protein BWY10_01694 [Chloroflexi bacterium ADurb.Bin180]|nr:MAG: hypothetical protein BWY10_01694 [Chloroflexi bacterium ADurb.Bin180]
MATCSNCGTELQPGQGFLVPSADKKAPAVHLCAGCAEKAEATFEEESRAPRVPQALLLGLLAAVVGCVLWYAVVVITNYELGIVAIAIGWLIGTAVMFGAGRKRRRVLQIMAVLITLVALLFSEYLIVRHFAVKHLTEQGYTGIPLFLSPSIMMGLVVEGIKASPTSLLFWAIALWQAFVTPTKRAFRKVPV